NSEVYREQKTIHDAAVDRIVESVEKQTNEVQDQGHLFASIAWTVLGLSALAFVISTVMGARVGRRWVDTEFTRLSAAVDRADQVAIGVVIGSSRGLCVLDAETGQASFVNERMSELLRLPVEELKTGEFLKDALAHQEVDSVLAPLFDGRLKEYGWEELRNHPQEPKLWLYWKLQPISQPSPEGSSMDILVQVLDITERKEREERLRAELAAKAVLIKVMWALREDRMELHAQPIVELATGAVSHSELLIRSRDRDGSLIPPGDFLPQAEESGLIGQIDRWVIDRAGALARAGTRVSVNISAASVTDPAILDQVKALLQDPGLAPSDMVFEITETGTIENLDKARQFALAVADLGSSVALDDFGTGHAGFAYLKNFPAKWLKIDIEYVKNALTDARDQQVISATVALADTFGAWTVAEGIEDKETLELVKKLGVTHAQGYYLGRPSPITVPDARPEGTQQPPNPSHSD
ncbi:MAG: EAL domain-containing protein, partial [Actinomycetia bacterium]|nr:EAL domain-containing protein [Actinomycetes bacterium]